MLTWTRSICPSNTTLSRQFCRYAYIFNVPSHVATFSVKTCTCAQTRFLVAYCGDLNLPAQCTCAFPTILIPWPSCCSLVPHHLWLGKLHVARIVTRTIFSKTLMMKFLGLKILASIASTCLHPRNIEPAEWTTTLRCHSSISMCAFAWSRVYSWLNYNYPPEAWRPKSTIQEDRCPCPRS